MSAFEDRLGIEGRELARRGRDGADTDEAWRAFTEQEHATRRGARRPNRAWIATAAAGLLVAAAVASTLLVGGDGSDSGVASPPPDAAVDDTSAPTPSVDDSTNPTSPTSPGSAPDSGPSANNPSDPSAPPDADSPTDTGTESFPPGRPCTYTDPARRAITVSRALSCPDGTEVWVDGVLVVTGDGMFLCDRMSGNEGAPCDGATLELVGGAGRDRNGGYSGVVQDGRLLVAGPAGGLPPSDPPPPPVPPGT